MFDTLKALTTQNISEAGKTDPEDKNKDGVVSPSESSAVRTASDDMKAARLHADNLEKLADTYDIRNPTIMDDKRLNAAHSIIFPPGTNTSLIVDPLVWTYLVISVI